MCAHAYHEPMNAIASTRVVHVPAVSGHLHLPARYDHVGSFLRPDYLLAARARQASGAIGASTAAALVGGGCLTILPASIGAALLARGTRQEGATAS